MAERALLRSYGRRKGKPLSARKERLVRDLLPRLRPDLGKPAPLPLERLFAARAAEVWLEIGFGSGEHLLWQLEQNPDVALIGCEPFINGVATLLGAVEERDLEPRICVHDGDVREVLAWLPDRSLARVFLLFPDPWPKKRQQKRRLISPDTVRDLTRVMAPGAELRFASDDEDYTEQVRLAIGGDGGFAAKTDARIRPADWPETRYERKALREGRKPAYLGWERL